MAELYVVKTPEGKVVALTNINTFEGKYVELGYTFGLLQLPTTISLDSVVKDLEARITTTKKTVIFIDWTYYKDGNYYYVEGIIRNVGQDTKSYVKVKALAYDKQKKLVTLKEGYSDPMDLEPGQEGTFKIMVKYNERISSFEVRIDY
ncbi:hypothetical protein ES705_27523 [subsurface metagenome]